MTEKLSIFERLRRIFLGDAQPGSQPDLSPHGPGQAYRATPAQSAATVAPVAVSEPAAELPMLDEAPEPHPTTAAGMDHVTAPPHEPVAEWPAAEAASAIGEAPAEHPTAAVDPADLDHDTAPPHEPVSALNGAGAAPTLGDAPAGHPTAPAGSAALALDPPPNEADAQVLRSEATAATFIEGAREALRADDAAAAILLLRDAAALFPQVAQVHQELARGAASVADWPLAEQAWRDFLRLVTTEGTAYAGLAAALRAQDRADEAEAVLGDGVVAVPGDATLAIDHAQMAEQRGDWPAAAERWRALAELRPDLPDGPFGHAVALQRLGAGDAAEAVLAEIVQRFPDHASALHDLARLAERRQDWATAERSWRAFNAVHADIWWSHSALIGAVLRQGRAAEAESLLQQAMLRFPDDPNLLADHARHAESSNDWPEAIRRWEELIARFPAAWTGYGGKITALARMGRQDEADQALLAYAPLLPEDAGALHDLARHAERHQDWQAAEAAWRGFLRQDPRMDWAWLGLAQALAQQDRRATAAEVLADAIAQVPGSLLLTIEAARLSDARDRHAEALDHWREVARLWPTAPDGAIGEANALARQGDAEGADAVIEAAIARLPDQPALYEAHAELAVMRGDWPAALARLQAGQQRFPATPGFAARISEIEARLAAADGGGDSEGDDQGDDQGGPGPDAEADQIRALLLGFESLGGGGGHGGEFARFQREHGAEPLGLLQWAEVLPDELAQALEAEFAGMGEPEQTALFIPPDAETADYWVTDRRYGIAMPSFIPADELPPDQAQQQIEKRIRFLRTKLIDDLRAGSKIFVYLHSKRNVTAPELDRLHRACRRYGANTLFYIRHADAQRPAGTVTSEQPGLLIGAIDHFSHAAETDEYLGSSTALLLRLCRGAHALWREHEVARV